jgi:hypothetical protein
MFSAAAIDTQWSAPALELVRSCAQRSFEDAAVVEHGMCHGTAGVAHIFHRLALATGEEIAAVAARRWLDRLIAERDALPRDDASLLTGTAGIALVLQAAISDDEPSWDRLFLLS